MLARLDYAPLICDAAHTQSSKTGEETMRLSVTLPLSKNTGILKASLRIVVSGFALLIVFGLWLVGCQAPGAQISCTPGPGECYFWNASYSGDSSFSFGVCCDQACECRTAGRGDGEDVVTYTDGHYGCYPGYAGQGNYYCNDDCDCRIFGQDIAE
jgi:hypothetical protein